MGFFREYGLVLAVSLVFHLMLLAAMVWVMPSRPPVPPERLAIQAKVIDESAARRAREQREEEQRRQQEAERQRELEEERERQRQAEQEREQQRQAEEAARQKKAEDEAKRKAEEDAKRRAEEEARRKAEEEAKRKAEEEARRQAEAQRRREQELQSQLADELAAEEALEAARSSGALDEYKDLIGQKVNRNWVRPPTARPGISCEVTVRQIPGGEVVDVRIGQCNGDDAVRRSIEAAVYQASPLPEPSDPRLFDRTLIFTFKPEE